MIRSGHGTRDHLCESNITSLTCFLTTLTVAKLPAAVDPIDLLCALLRCLSCCCWSFCCRLCSCLSQALQRGQKDDVADNVDRRDGGGDGAIGHELILVARLPASWR